MSTRPATHRTILVIEDYVDSRQMLRLLLQEEGYQVFTAGNAEEALALVRTKRVDLIVTDFGLPGMDGITLVRRFRDLESPVKSVPIIMLTALENEDCNQAAMAAGCSGFLGKPVYLERLLVMMEHLLTGSAGVVSARNLNVA